MCRAPEIRALTRRHFRLSAYDLPRDLATALHALVVQCNEAKRKPPRDEPPSYCAICGQPFRQRVRFRRRLTCSDRCRKAKQREVAKQAREQAA